MDLIANLGLGLSVTLTPTNVLFCFVGAMVGTLIGVLPGIGPLATMAILLPITFTLPPTTALIMLAGIYYGAQYGGSTTAILVNIPGESSSVVTCLDGHQMARQGRAGAALAITAMGSFFAGCVVTVLIALAAPPLSAIALKFAAPEYFSLMVVGLVGAVVLAHGSVLKAIGVVLVGLLLGLVGTDITSGTQRYTFGIQNLADGIGVVAVAMGLFGLTEVIGTLEGPTGSREIVSQKVRGLMPTRADFRASFPAIARGTVIGSVLGVLPGGGALLSSFTSYIVEKKVARDPSRFGRGAIEGVAGPESANNAGAQASFIPMLTLGIPSNPVMAMMIGALLIQGIAPGPQVMTKQPELFWGLIASMWLGNLMLVIINLPLIGIWVSLLRVPYRMLFPAILLFCAIGVYSVSNATFDVLLTAGFGLFGYLLHKLGFEPAPMLMGLILGPMMEENMRRAMTVSRGDPLIFLRRPLSATLLAIAALLLLIVVLPNVRRSRETVFQD
jgi:putative tricarboxylic transport membrane protein